MQCQAITKLGIQCSRKARLSSKYCWQHQTNSRPHITSDLKYLIASYLLPEDIIKLFGFKIAKYIFNAYKIDLDLDYNIITGNIYTLQFLIKDGTKLPNYALNLAIEYGQLDVAKYLIKKQGFKITPDDIIAGLYTKNDRLIAYLFKIAPEQFTTDALNIAIEYDMTNIVEKLAEKNVQPDDKTLYLSVDTDFLFMVAYCVDQGIVPTHADLEIAVERGYLDIVQYLIEEVGLKYTYEDIQIAKRYGSHNVTDYLKSKLKI